MLRPRTALSAEARSRLIGVILIVAAVLLWSTVPVGTRLLVGQRGSAFSAAFISAARLWVAAAIFLGIGLFQARRAREPFRLPLARPQWLAVAAGALCFNYILYAIGLRHTTASATSIVSQVHTVATVLLAALLLGERLTARKALGMVVATSGVLAVVLRGQSSGDLLASEHFWGNLIEFVAALGWPFYAIGQTKLLEHDGDRRILLPIFLLAAAMTTLLLPTTGPLIIGAPTSGDWLALLFLGAGSTAAAYWLFAAGVQRMETSEGAMFNVLMPPAALLLGHWLLRETLTPHMLLGMGLVLVGLVLIVWRRSSSPLRVRRHATAGSAGRSACGAPGGGDIQ